LEAYYAFPFYLSAPAIGVFNAPETAQQLHRMQRAVLDDDVVPKYVFMLHWIGVVGQVLRFYRYPDAVIRQRIHINPIKQKHAGLFKKKPSADFPGSTGNEITKHG
jgi:hypothetical protein